MSDNPNPNLLAHRVFPNGAAISLLRNDSGFSIEVVARRMLDGRPWYPTLDTDFVTNEHDARNIYEEQEYRWQRADETELGSEVLASPEEWDRSTPLLFPHPDDPLAPRHR